jgi:hypothetical protein
MCEKNTETLEVAEIVRHFIAPDQKLVSSKI